MGISLRILKPDNILVTLLCDILVTFATTLVPFSSGTELLGCVSPACSPVAATA